MAEGIRSFEVIPYSLGFREEYVTSRGSLERRELILLRVVGEDGVVGLGEAVPWSLRGGESLTEISGELERMMSRLAGGKVGEALASVTSGGSTQLGISNPARVAIEMALTELEARRAGVPFYRQLAPESRPREIELNATLGAGDPASAAREAHGWLEAGFRTFKVKVGDRADVERVGLLRQEIGPEAIIRVDANGSWSLDEALERVDELAPLDIELFEEPVAGLEEMARFRDSTDVTVVADESVSDRADARRAEELGACDAVTVKLSKTGTLDPSLGSHLPTYLSSALDGPVGIAAALHVAMTTSGQADRSFAQGLATARLFRETIAVGDPAWLIAPFTTVPEEPGLGIEIDEAALDTLRL